MGEPVVSVDTMKKELVGEFKNAGKEWQPQGTPSREGPRARSWRRDLASSLAAHLAFVVPRSTTGSPTIVRFERDCEVIALEPTGVGSSAMQVQQGTPMAVHKKRR